MDMRKYQEEARRTSNAKNREDKLLNAALGLSGEVGEVVDHIKKWKFQGHELNKKEIIEELGDVLWYIGEMADGINADLGKIAENNIAKLQQRYPTGFEEAKSRNRKQGAIKTLIKDTWKLITTNMWKIPPRPPAPEEVQMEEALTKLSYIVNQEIPHKTREEITEMAKELSIKTPLSYTDAIEQLTGAIETEINKKGSSLEEAMNEIRKDFIAITGNDIYLYCNEETIRTIGKNLGIPIKEIIQSQEKMTIHTQTSNIAAIEKFNKELQRIKPAWMTLEIDNQCKI